MTNALQTAPKASALQVMASRFSVEPTKLLETLKATAFKNASNEEMMALVIVANQYGLNPFTKEIYAFPAKGGGIQPVVSVDGWLRLMNEHPAFDGIEFEELLNEEDSKPISTTCIIHRKDRTKPTRITEWFSECYRKTDPWDTKPIRMLRHKATIQAIRTAFGFAGISDEEDVIDVTPTLVSTGPIPHEDPKQLADAGLAPVQTDPNPTMTQTAHQELDSILTAEGYDLAVLLKWGAQSGSIKNADSVGRIEDIPGNEVALILKAIKGRNRGMILGQLSQAKMA